MSNTRLNSITIKKFRGLDNIKIDFGTQISLICGKNGTSKSSILGIAAQIFSFDTNYVKKERINYRRIDGQQFKSPYKEHFRISDKYDASGSMQVFIDLFDGYSNKPATANLGLFKRDNEPRPIVRNNSTADVNNGENQSRNFTHPVIYLGLKRLYPIAERQYSVTEHDHFQKNKHEFLSITNEILNKTSTKATETKGTITSAVAHGDNYDQDSVSAGEDNVGQIALALMSFKKLKEDYPDYKGGLLLIDEADAGLFPAAQIKLLDLLAIFCKNLNLQVIMTSHSPIIIEHVYKKSQHFRNYFKTIYLSDTYTTKGVDVYTDWSWERIEADINTRTILDATNSALLPEVSIYFEDKEAIDFYNALISRQPLKKWGRVRKKVSLGCATYLHLINNNISEFSLKSIVCLDADVKKNVLPKHKTVVLLPGELPPDQLIFEFLYNLPPDDEFWRNELLFSREVFIYCAGEVIREFEITGDSVSVAERIKSFNKDKKPREIFKRFYKNQTIQKIVNCPVSSKHNVWTYWVSKNKDLVDKFLKDFQKAMSYTMSKGHSVPSSRLSHLKIKPKL